jgi:hypothetical protein
VQERTRAFALVLFFHFSFIKLGLLTCFGQKRFGKGKITKKISAWVAVYIKGASTKWVGASMIISIKHPYQEIWVDYQQTVPYIQCSLR